MTELIIYKKTLQKISQYGIKPTSETEMQRIKRLKSIADKALFIADVMLHTLVLCFNLRFVMKNKKNYPITL
jgi:hypothetical protein